MKRDSIWERPTSASASIENDSTQWEAVTVPYTIARRRVCGWVFCAAAR